MLRFKNNLIICLLIVAIGCTTTESDSVQLKNTKVNNIQKVASEKFGDNYSLEYNSTKEFVICSTKGKSKVAGNSPFNYFIFNTKSNKIIEENTIILGNIFWISQYEVKVDIHSGIVRKNSSPSNGYILNVKTNSKTKINGGVK